jgi:hypothetical protein
MNISWFDTSSIDYGDLDAADLTTANTNIELTYGNTPYKKDIWIVNNGTEDAMSGILYQVGFWIDSNSMEDLAKVLNLGGQLHTETGIPCGLYLVFGYSDDGGGTSWLSKFEGAFEGGPETPVTSEEASQFHFNWNQGTSILNKLMMNASDAYTYNGSSGYQRRTTLYVNNDYLNADGSGKGALKITLYLVVPDAGASLLSNIRLNLHAVEGIE